MEGKRFHRGKGRGGEAAFTIQYGQLVRVLDSDVGVCFPDLPEGTQTEKVRFTKCRAIWDTGSTCSAITSKIIESLGLKPSGATKVRNTSGTYPSNKYLVDMKLPNDVVINAVSVVEADLGKDYGVLIGMDIIGRGAFSVTHPNGKTVRSFRMPSTRTIDFVPELQFEDQFSSKRA